VVWRAEEMVVDPAGELTRVLSTILNRNSIAVRQAAE
jgi:hypothetical protein